MRSTKTPEAESVRDMYSSHSAAFQMPSEGGTDKVLNQNRDIRNGLQEQQLINERMQSKEPPSGSSSLDAVNWSRVSAKDDRLRMSRE